MARPDRRLTIGLFVLAAQVVVAQTATPREDDRYAEASAWLRQNAGAPQTGAMLLQLVEDAPTISDVRAALSAYGDRVSDDGERARIEYAAGRLLERANRLSEARDRYLAAFRADGTLWESALRSTALDVELGDYADAVARAAAIIRGAPRRDQQRSAALLRARALWLAGEPLRGLRHARELAGIPREQSAATIARTVEPAALLLVVEIAHAADLPEEAVDATRTLEEVFPDSPEMHLARSLINPAEGDAVVLPMPTPGRLLGADRGSVGVAGPSTTASDDSPRQAEDSATPDTPAAQPAGVAGIQTGSFRDRENARFMAEDIERMGFPVEVRDIETQNGRFYRVVVTLPADATVESAQATVVSLKERGVEGFLLFR